MADPQHQTIDFLPGFPGALASVAPRVDLAVWTAALTAPMRLADKLERNGV